MTTWHERLGVASVLLAVLPGGCATEEVATDQLALSNRRTDGATASLAISLVGDFDTFEDERAAIAAGTGPTSAYFLRVDGRWVVIDDGVTRYQPTIIPGTFLRGTWVPAGPHRFDLVDGEGHTAASAGPYTIAPDTANHLVFYGRRQALDQRFFATDLQVPAGQQRYTVLNLIRAGSPVEVVTCSDAGAAEPRDCVAVSPPLGLGELATGEVPRSAADTRSALSIGVYYRMVPTAEAPAPPVLPLSLDWQAGLDPGRLAVVRLYVAAPIFMGRDGSTRETL